MSKHGLTVEQLAQATRRKPVQLRFVLDDELHAGRIVRDDDGRFTLAVDAFESATLRALVALAPPEVLRSSTLRDEASGTAWEPPKHARTSGGDSQYVRRARSVSGALRTREGVT